MTERGQDVYAEGPEDALLGGEESLDSDNIGELGDGGDPLDDGWDAPDRQSPADRFGTTAAEQLRGESLDDLLAEEEPDVDPYAEAALRESGSVLESDVTDVRGVGPGDLIDDTGSDRAIGQLVSDDEGAHADETADLVARESAGGGDLAAEDAALHLDPDD
jgi:hypothetical protein